MNTLNYNITNINRTLEEIQEKEEKKEQRKALKKQLEIRKIMQQQEDYKRFYDEIYQAVNDFFIIYNNIDLAYYHAIAEREKVILNNFTYDIKEAYKLYDEILEDLKVKKIEELQAKKQIEYKINYNNIRTKEKIKKGCLFVLELLRDGLAVAIIIFIGLLCMDTGKTKRKKWIY